jgi:hypothetical protein
MVRGLRGPLIARGGLIHVVDVTAAGVKALGVLILEYLFLRNSEDRYSDIHVQLVFFFEDYLAGDGLPFPEDNRIGAQIRRETEHQRNHTADTHKDA